MNLKEVPVLVVGAAKSGVEAAKLLILQGAQVSLYDGKAAAELNLDVALLSKLKHCYFGGVEPPVEQFACLVLSPGVPPSLPFIVAARQKGIEVIGEVELARRYSKGRFIGITGTNGKTTTTALTAHILQCAGIDAKAVGNIGVALSSVVNDDDKAIVYVVELSSYQLETIVDFKLDCAAILNITPDHLSRHKTMQAYTAAKLKIANGLPNDQTLLLNLDNSITRDIFEQFKPRATTFSRVESGADIAILDENIVLSGQKILPTKDVLIRGEHNLENALAAVGLASFMGVDGAVIAKGLRSFQGVAHRNELFFKRKGIHFYNDSKATNPEATIPALKTIDLPTVLIAGGMDKGSNYQVMLPYMTLVEHVVLLGETKFDIAEALRSAGYLSYTIVENMDQAVATAIKRVSRPGNVLLSPACASWDMYQNFEARGEHFKRCVERQMEEFDEKTS